MAQLEDRFHQVERLKARKARTTRHIKKEKIAYIDTYDSDLEFDSGTDGPPYVCKLLRPSNGKNPEEPKNDKYPPKTYTFDVTKCEEIFDLLVADGIVLVPKNLKVPPVEQRKKRGFCKFHGFLGHNLSRCTRFRDSVQKTRDEGRLKFGDKAKQAMQVDTDPLKNVDSMYTEVVSINMVDVFEGLMAIEESMQAENLLAVDGKVTEDHSFDDMLDTTDQFAEKIEVAYPKAEEDLIDFLNKCKISNTNAMLCPRYSAMFDKEVAKSVEGFRPQPKTKGRWADGRLKFGFNKRGIPYKMRHVERSSH